MQSRALTLFLAGYALLFAATGALVIVIANTDDATTGFPLRLKDNVGLVFAWHLACWMVAGMIANYYWDLFNADRGFADMQLPRLLLPLLVAPIVFYPTWSLWLSSNHDSYILFELISFQNGFFWQALFAKRNRRAATAGCRTSRVEAAPAGAWSG